MIVGIAPYVFITIFGILNFIYFPLALSKRLSQSEKNEIGNAENFYEEAFKKILTKFNINELIHIQYMVFIGIISVVIGLYSIFVALM